MRAHTYTPFEGSLDGAKSSEAAAMLSDLACVQCDHDVAAGTMRDFLREEKSKSIN